MPEIFLLGFLIAALNSILVIQRQFRFGPDRDIEGIPIRSKIPQNCEYDGLSQA